MPVQIDLTGPDGNAFALLAIAKRLSAQIGHDPDRSEQIRSDMRSGDYDRLLDVFEREFGELVHLVNRPDPAQPVSR
jgi:hypothetical protein